MIKQRVNFTISQKTNNVSGSISELSPVGGAIVYK